MQFKRCTARHSNHLLSLIHFDHIFHPHEVVRIQKHTLTYSQSEYMIKPRMKPYYVQHTLYNTLQKFGYIQID